VCVALAQDSGKLAERCDAAAHADRHAEAIRCYEDAIHLDPSLRGKLLVKLARQYLWSDRPWMAAALFAERLQAEPADCEAKIDYALALSWANRLGEARQTYQEAGRSCANSTNEARLGEGRVLRWMDRPTAADTVYRQVLTNGEAHQKQDAQLGLALDRLALDDNRLAQQMFRALIDAGSLDPGAFTGEAVSDLHLGLPDHALVALAEARQANLHDPQLNNLETHVAEFDRLTLSPSFQTFQDADGTRYQRAELLMRFGWRLRNHAEFSGGYSRLRSQGESVEAKWGGLTVDRRFDASWAVRLEGHLTSYTGAAVGTGYKPLTGEADTIWTPTDGWRVDLAAARLVIADNLAALEHHVAGTFTSAGITRRLDDHNTFAASFDATAWNQGNLRLRYRFDLAHRFEGTPRFTLEWPTLYQTYDHPFPFPLFSPRQYIETGPAVNVYRRYRRYWTLSLYGRLGGQKESEATWKGLGTVRGQLERELHRRWGLELVAFWSSSNLASPSGFRRRSFSLTFKRKL
jgi:tetratricopeptide (TPR) repeat protein